MKSDCSVFDKSIFHLQDEMRLYVFFSSVCLSRSTDAAPSSLDSLFLLLLTTRPHHHLHHHLFLLLFLRLIIPSRFVYESATVSASPRNLLLIQQIDGNYLNECTVPPWIGWQPSLPTYTEQEAHVSLMQQCLTQCNTSKKETRPSHINQRY